MNETAAGMTQTMPLYLILVGVVLIGALVYLLLKMRKGGAEKESVSPEGASDETPAAAVEPLREEEERERIEPETATEAAEEKKPESRPPETAPPVREASSSLPVQETAFEETPDIGRESFESFAGKQVLVVEDNPVNRKLILTLMAGSGIDLDSAEDGVEALEKLRAPGAHYDLVLMDVNMPRMDGLECTREIRKDENLRSIPVLALTASTDQDEVNRILESGMNGYLDKPINLGKLYTAFVRFVREYQISKSGSAASGPEVETDASVLDTNVGKEHTNEDAGLYRMLLEDFLQEYGSSGERFKSLVEAKDYEGLHRLIIDLEGLTGTLGAMELYKLVLEVNRVLDRGTTMLLADYSDEYATAMERLKKEIENYLGA
jgi:CheY-like chemotaxis protein/HPt (histidine-containing phosphotransfer) domain-containing protein